MTMSLADLERLEAEIAAGLALMGNPPGESLAVLDAVRLARRLFQAIVAHRAQKAEDRCIEDDDRLYEALGDGIKCDRRVGDKAAMLANCQRFIERRCEGGGWPSYADLEAENRRLRAVLMGKTDNLTP